MADNAKPKKTQELKVVLGQRDGWNFGLGFMAAVFVFSFILIPLLICSVAAALAMLPGLIS